MTIESKQSYTFFLKIYSATIDLCNYLCDFQSGSTGNVLLKMMKALYIKIIKIGSSSNRMEIASDFYAESAIKS